MLEPSKEVQLKKELDRLDSRRLRSFLWYMYSDFACRRGSVLDSIDKRMRDTEAAMVKMLPVPFLK